MATHKPFHERWPLVTLSESPHLPDRVKSLAATSAIVEGRAPFRPRKELVMWARKVANGAL